MGTIEHYRKLFRYDQWANVEVLQALRATRPGSGIGSLGHEGEPLQHGLNRLAHILGAEWLWLARLSVPAKAAGVWPELSLDECGRQVEVLGNVWEGTSAGSRLQTSKRRSSIRTRRVSRGKIAWTTC